MVRPRRHKVRGKLLTKGFAMNVTTTKTLEYSEAKAVWSAFERLYPSVASAESPSDFAKKLVAAYITVFEASSDTNQPPCE